MERILECVPNFSEGTNEFILDELSNVAESASGVKLLHRDAGESANRTVYTIAGDPMKVLDVAFKMVKKATELIDMNQYKGIHPCFGATDVIPLIPIKGISFDEAIMLADKLAQRIAAELKIPVYLYDKAAKRDKYVSLSEVRRGGFVGIDSNIRSKNYKPDYGPSAAHRTAGAVAVGVRKLMVAYNVNLNAPDKNVASRIAEKIRESGIVITGDDGNAVDVPGIFQKVKAIGWYIPEFGKAQVSMNLMDIDQSPLHEVFNVIKDMAESEGVEVTGSELVGLMPLQCLEQTAKYLKTDFFLHPDTVIEYLGLNDVKHFDLQNQILEYALKDLSY